MFQPLKCLLERCLDFLGYSQAVILVCRAMCGLYTMTPDIFRFDNKESPCPCLNLLGVHDVHWEIKGTKHNIAISIAIMCGSGGHGLRSCAVSGLGPSRARGCSPWSGPWLSRLGRGSLHQVDYFSVYICKHGKGKLNILLSNGMPWPTEKQDLSAWSAVTG